MQHRICDNVNEFTRAKRLEWNEKLAFVFGIPDFFLRSVMVAALLSESQQVLLACELTSCSREQYSTNTRLPTGARYFSVIKAY